jgi:tetratricopeptide (TPR) repeat protein
MDASFLARLKEELLRCEALPSSERDARLAELRREAPELEQELRSLLAQAPIPEIGSLDVTLQPQALHDGANRSSRVQALRTIGPYELLDVLGVGGMGIVYRARQREPLEREVAIKLLRGGLDPARVLARFAGERRAMAMLEHPAIARILDAGLDVDGMPYLVTELVRGVPISRYCRERALGVPEILRLFVTVCRAVQHAHQKGIIHRDLKPSNVLVTEVDGAPRPKVIDFGIARLLEEETSPGGTLTIEGQAIGTLGYMSPEQAAGAVGTDTRADVYSLGVMLHELLTGALPHDFEGRSTAEALARIAAGETRPVTIEGRGRSRDGDLETIVRKAIEPDPAARYDGAGAFAEDLERYLRHETILARPPSTAYMLRKLVQRHRAAFIGGVVATGLIALFAIAMTMLYAGQRRERRRAEVESSRATALNSFLVEMLGAAQPNVMGRDVTVREVLDKAVTEVDSTLGSRPLIQAAVARTLATTYRELGDYPIADSLYRRGLELELQQRGPRDIEVARVMRELADNTFQWRRREQADSLCRIALAMSEAIAGPRSPEVEACLLLGADIQTKLGRAEPADSLLTRYMDLARAAHGDSSLEVARGFLLHGMIDEISASNSGPDYLTAVRLFTRTLGPDHPTTLEALDDYTDDLIAHRRYHEAVAIGRDVLARMRRTHGISHPRVGEVMNRLARASLSLGATAEAESLELGALAIWRSSMGEESSLMPAGYAVMGDIAWQRGDLAASEAWVRRSLALSLRVHPDGHPRSVGEMQQLARILARRGKYHEADTLFRHMIDIRARTVGLSTPASLGALGEYGVFLFDRGRVDSAARYLGPALAVAGHTNPEAAIWKSVFALCEASAGRGPHGDSLLVESLHDMALSPPEPDQRRIALKRVLGWFDAHGERTRGEAFRKEMAGR